MRPKIRKPKQTVWLVAQQKGAFCPSTVYTATTTLASTPCAKHRTVRRCFRDRFERFRREHKNQDIAQNATNVPRFRSQSTANNHSFILFFTTHSSSCSVIDNLHIERCIQVKCDRLNRKPTASEMRKKGYRQSALDTTIHILPSMLLSNSTPVRLKFRAWQHHVMVKSRGDRGHDLGGGGGGFSNLMHNMDKFGVLDDRSGSVTGLLGLDDDHHHLPHMHMPSGKNLLNSLKHRGTTKLHFKDIAKKVKNVEKLSHLGNHKKTVTQATRRMKTEMGYLGGQNQPFYSTNTIEKGMDMKLVGVNMKEDLFISISKEDDEESSWSKPIKLDMKKFKSSDDNGVCSLGPDLDIQIAMSVDLNHKRRCTIFSPDWIVNKTGMALQYKLSGRAEPVNSLSKGDLAIMVKSGKGRNVMCIPVSEPQQDNIERYWDVNRLGNIKFIDNFRFKPDVNHMTAPTTSQAKKDKRKARRGVGVESDEKEIIVDWSNQVGFDNVGTTDELRCGNLLLGVTTDTMTGVFVGSNVCTFWPRFIVQNSYAFDIRLIPLAGPQATVSSTLKECTRGVESAASKHHKNHFITLKSGESSVIYAFEPTSRFDSVQAENLNDRYIGFEVLSDSPTGKWHIIPANYLGEFYFSERHKYVGERAKQASCSNTRRGGRGLSNTP